MRRKFAILLACAGLFLAATGLYRGVTADGLAGAGLGEGSSPARLLSAVSDDSDYDLAEIRYFRLAAHKINGEYVDPTRVDPKDMLSASLDRVARQVPQFLYRFDSDSGTLEIVAGAATRNLSTGSLESIVDLTVVVAQVAGFLDRTLPEDMERPPIEYALMNGMLKTLDPHSVYIDPDSYQEMSIQNKGHFGGLGITIGIREERLTVLYPLKETPAWRAGLKAGDHIDKIGSESTVNMSLQEAVSMLRGPEGTDVTITVSDDEGPDREVTITRARIDVPSVEWAYAGDGIGLIEVSHFAQKTYDSIEDALDDLGTQAMAEGHGRLQGLIFDLRQNPGGYLQQAIEVADKFLDGGVIVSTEGLAGKAREDTNARRFGTEDDLPIVVLVDEGSASASEIVAGALQNHGRGVVMGVRTFGKGSVQNLYDRDFNSGALKMTIAQYLTPGNQSIQGVGIVPDIELRPAVIKSETEGPDIRMYWQDFELREEDLEHSFTWGEESNQNDQVRWVYACNECFETVDNDRETGPADNLKDPEVEAAKALLTSAPSSRSSDMLRAAGPTLDKLFRARQVELNSALGNVGIDWSLPPGQTRRGKRKAAARRSGAAVPSPAAVRMKVDTEEGVLEPGVEGKVTLHVTNEGRQPLHRLRAVTEGDFFGGREFFFGKVPAGETRSYSVRVKPALWLNARTDEVTWHFFSEGAPAPAPYVGRLQIKDVPHPRFAFSYQVIDDGTGASVGNGDGLLQAGEEIDLLVHVTNKGEGGTSDQWMAQRTEALRSESKSDTGEEEPAAAKKNGFIRLRNRAGDAVFLTKGSDSFSVGPGENTTTRLHFRVADDQGERDSIELDLTVGDSKFLEILNSEIEFPLFQPTEGAKPLAGLATPSTASVPVRAGASQHSEIVGYLEGPTSVVGRLGSWIKLALPWEASGWVEASSVTLARRGKDAVAPRRHLSNSPPTIGLTENPGGQVVSTEQLQLTAIVQDDSAIQDIFVYVNEKKVLYEAVVGTMASRDFVFEVPLTLGENRIEIFARDDQDHLRALAIGVYREAS
jgi:carboxyl-terminal processing protease